MERGFAFDVESLRSMDETASPDPISCAKIDITAPEKVCNGYHVKGENLGGKADKENKDSPEGVQVLIEIDKNVEGVVDTDPLEKKNRKDRRKSTSAKKHPKPPRPPRGLSLDAADQKLIKELAELAMIKRARLERMKALKKMKAAKGSSMPSSSGGSFLAMLLTVLFCVVIFCQGMSSRMNSAVSFNSPLVSPEAMESSFIAIESHTKLSSNDTNSTPSGPSTVAYSRKRAAA